MKKKRLIIILSVLAAIVLIVVLSSTVFTLKDVVINFYDYYDKMIDDITISNSYYDTNEKVQAVIDSADFNYGQNIFLLNKKSYREKIEKNNPYIKVISMSIEFPSRLVVKAVERSEYYAVLNKDAKFFICDADFKILRETETVPENIIKVSAQNDLGSQENIFEYANLGFDYKVGDFINLNENIKALTDFADEMFTCHYEKEKLLNTFSSLTIYKKPSTNAVGAEEVEALLIKTFSGVEIEIENFNLSLGDKITKAIEIYTYLLENKPEATVTGTIKVFDNLTGEYEV